MKDNKFKSEYNKQQLKKTNDLNSSVMKKKEYFQELKEKVNKNKKDG